MIMQIVLSARLRSAFFISIIVAASACARPVRIDETSAAGHRVEAAKELAEANAHRRAYDPAAAGYDHRSGGAFGSEGGNAHNPTEWNLGEANRHAQHAAEHEKAAHDLEAFESSACATVPPAERSACPLMGPVVSAANIPDGVELRYRDGAPVEAMVVHMRCHMAFARTRGFPAEMECPLYMKGVEVRPAAGSVIALISSDKGVVNELRRLAQAIVPLPRPTVNAR